MSRRRHATPRVRSWRANIGTAILEGCSASFSRLIACSVSGFLVKFKLFSDEQVYPQGSMNVPVRKKSKSVARAAEQTYFSHGCDF